MFLFTQFYGYYAEVIYSFSWGCHLSKLFILQTKGQKLPNLVIQDTYLAFLVALDHHSSSIRQIAVCLKYLQLPSINYLCIGCFFSCNTKNVLRPPLLLHCLLQQYVFVYLTPYSSDYIYLFLLLVFLLLFSVIIY